MSVSNGSSAKHNSVRAEWLRGSGRAPSEPSETPQWRITAHLASIQRVAFHIAPWSLFRRFFLLWRSPMLNDHSRVMANCDHTSEWVHWVRTCIGIAMRWVTLQKSLVPFVSCLTTSSYLWSDVRAANNISHAEDMQSNCCQWCSYLYKFRDGIQVTQVIRYCGERQG